MNDVLRIGLPKGRMERAVLDLLADGGVQVTPGARGYRPHVQLDCVEAKVLKPQNIVEMLMLGSRDVGFAGADWVQELSADVVEVLDTGLDPVEIVAAAPEGFMQVSANPPAELMQTSLNRRLEGVRQVSINRAEGFTHVHLNRKAIVASEYEQLARNWISKRQLDATVVRSYGATEVFPPEDADIVIDCTATGATLRANGLAIVDTLLKSSTRLYASPTAWTQPSKRRRIEDLALLLASVLEARQRVMLEVNASSDALARVVAVLPAMRQPTVSPLFGNGSYAVKAAVPRNQLARIIPAVRAAGGTDVVVSSLSQIVP